MKFNLLCDAKKIACEFKELSDLGDFKFHIIDYFLVLGGVAKHEVLEHTISDKKTNLTIIHADSSGIVRKTFVCLDQTCENTKVTNDVLIFSDEGITFVKAFKK